jgi:myotubularin-related protein 1/2
MLSTIRNFNPHKTKLTIYDARPHLNATANRVRGGGFEDERHCPGCSLVFLDIENVHAVNYSFGMMLALAHEPDLFDQISKYGPEVEVTGYMQLLSAILSGTNKVVEAILVRKENVLIHCSDGWDRTA